MSAQAKTLKDLAGELGISVATASRALAGHERIALKTRERVAAAARDMGYVPNRAARALVSGRSGFAALALPLRSHVIDDWFLGDFVSGLTSGLGRAGVDLLLAAVPEGKPEIEVIRSIVETRRADGIVLARITEEDPRIAYLMDRGFPFVAHGRVREETRAYAWVDTDGHSAFGEVFDLLYDLGHRQFGLVTIDEPLTFRRHRAAGLMAAIARRADPAVRLQTASSPRYDYPARHAAIRSMLTGPDRPTAVLGLFDGPALAVLQEAAALGLSTPADLSVVGFDDTSAATLAPPGLTTFRAGVHDSAEAVAEMLVRAVAAPDLPPETRLVRPNLILRGSHGPAPGKKNTT